MDRAQGCAVSVALMEGLGRWGFILRQAQDEAGTLEKTKASRCGRRPGGAAVMIPVFTDLLSQVSSEKGPPVCPRSSFDFAQDERFELYGSELQGG